MRKVEARKYRRARIDEAAAGHVDIENCGRREGMVHIKGECLGVIVFRAAVKAQPGSERIGRKVKQSEIGESPEDASRTRDVLIHTGHKFVVIASRATGRREIIRDSPWICRRHKVGVPHLRRCWAELRYGDLVI